MDKVDLENMIRAAFAGIQLDGGTSLRQCDVMDRYGEGITPQEFDALPLTEVTDDWTAISIETLARYASLAHMDPKGFRYYIPAFMIGVLRSCDPSERRSRAYRSILSGTLSILKGKNEYLISMYSLLNVGQRKAVAVFVQSLPALFNLDHYDVAKIERALQEYWGQFLTSPGT